jgi:uncharacterized protein (DUF983 family)
MTQRFLLTVPTNWPMLWAEGQNIRMACPSCGELHAYVVRPENTVSCHACGMAGVAAFQRKFNALTKTKPVPQIEEALAQ